MTICLPAVWNCRLKIGGMLAFSINFVTSFGYNGSEFFEERVKGIAMLSVGEEFV